jgi:hypothetical protein
MTPWQVDGDADTRCDKFLPPHIVSKEIFKRKGVLNKQRASIRLLFKNVGFLLAGRRAVQHPLEG